MPDLSKANATEEEKMIAMMNQSSEDYNPSRYTHTHTQHTHTHTHTRTRTHTHTHTHTDHTVYSKSYFTRSSLLQVCQVYRASTRRWWWRRYDDERRWCWWWGRCYRWYDDETSSPNISMLSLWAARSLHQSMPNQRGMHTHTPYAQ